MKKFSGIATVLIALLFCGCSGAFWGGTAVGGGGTATAYEVHAKRELDRVENDFKNGRIDQKEYDVRKDQIKRDSLIF